MIASRLLSQAPIESNPLKLVDLPRPEPAPDEVLIRVTVCGICRTDLHVIEGDLPPLKSPITPGHQIIGTIETLGSSVSNFSLGERVGVAWLHRTCGHCEYCLRGRENLCLDAAFTGYSVDGGYAEYAVAHKSFVYRIPGLFPDLQAAPLLCAGIIGFRSLRVCGIEKGGRLGLYGFGAAAHIAIQVARQMDIEVYAFTRNPRHQKHAYELGAIWAGGGDDIPGVKLDAAIVFAPAGELVISALKTLRRGGTVACAGIHMSSIPAIDYSLLYHERVVRSVANNTREDGEEFLKLAAAIPIRTQVEVFAPAEANTALNKLKHDAICGAAVLQIFKS